MIEDELYNLDEEEKEILKLFEEGKLELRTQSKDELDVFKKIAENTIKYKNIKYGSK